MSKQVIIKDRFYCEGMWQVLFQKTRAARGNRRDDIKDVNLLKAAHLSMQKQGYKNAGHCKYPQLRMSVCTELSNDMLESISRGKNSHSFAALNKDASRKFVGWKIKQW